MKFSLECNVIGKVKIGKQITVRTESKEYILLPDNKGWLSSIKIIKRVANTQKYTSKIEPGEGESKAKITIEGDREEYLALVREFQELESVLSFTTMGSLRRIEWDVVKEEFIPETEEEKKQVSISGLEFGKEYPDYPSYLDVNSFYRIVQHKHHYRSLMVPEAFFREGMNEFHSRRYVNAFYNFYFILEDFYGQGKTRNKDITDSFKNSAEFMNILRWIMDEYIDKHVKHRMNIQRFCQEEKVSYDINGMIDLLQKVRGNIHHYSSKSSKRLGTPFTQEDFESVAFMVMGLATRAISQKMLDISNSIK